MPGGLLARGHRLDERRHVQGRRKLPSPQPRHFGHPLPPFCPLEVATSTATKGQGGDVSGGESIGGTPRRPVWLSPDLERRGTNRRRTGRRNVCRRCWR